jgi:DNA-binding response OmpR family regulator
MRMESDAAGREVIQAARTAHYHPAVALLTAFPVEQDDWMEMGADRMLVKPMQTPVLIRQLEKLLESHAAKLAKISSAAAPQASEGKAVAKRPVSKKVPAKRAPAKKRAGRKPAR